MWSENLKKLATGNVLFNLNKIISPRLVTILYLIGLAAIGLWAITHFFATFRFGFGNGLWGLIEIAVYGLLGLIALRIVCEGIIVYFRAHETETDDVTPVRASGSLIDDVRDAIEELAEEEDDIIVTTPRPAPTVTPTATPVPPTRPAPVATKPIVPTTTPEAVAPATKPDQTPSMPVAEEPAIIEDADSPKPSEKPEI